MMFRLEVKMRSNRSKENKTVVNCALLDTRELFNKVCHKFVANLHMNSHQFFTDLVQRELKKGNHLRTIDFRPLGI